MIACSTPGARKPSRSPSRRALVAAGLAVLPFVADAQTTVARVDIGASRVRYADTLTLTATSITPEVTAEWPLAVVRAVASYSWLSGGGSSFQGVGGFSVFTPSAGVFLAELEGVGGGTRSEGTNTSQVVGIVRGHVAGSRAGVWVGAGGGSASNGDRRRPTRLAEAGGWAAFGPARASITVTPTTVEDSVRYTDISLVAHAALRRLDLSATAGSRSGTQPEIFGTPVKAWASASIVSWITQSVAIVAGAGRYPVDLTQGFPGGTYGSVGLRMAARVRNAPNNDPRAAPNATVIAPEAPDAPVGRLELNNVGGTRRMIYIRIPAARTVEIAGDFNSWRAAPLTRRPDGWWSIELEIDPGAYETSIRLDGGPWIAPPGLTLVRDEFAGEGGILVVP